MSPAGMASPADIRGECSDDSSWGRVVAKCVNILRSHHAVAVDSAIAMLSVKRSRYFDHVHGRGPSCVIVEMIMRFVFEVISGAVIRNALTTFLQ